MAAGGIEARPWPEFLPIGTVTIWGLIILGGWHPEHMGGFSSIPGPDPSMPGTPPSVTTTDVPRHHPMSWEGGRKRGRNQRLSCKLLKCGARPGREWRRQSPEPGSKGRQADGPLPPPPALDPSVQVLRGPGVLVQPGSVEVSRRPGHRRGEGPERGVLPSVSVGLQGPLHR